MGQAVVKPEPGLTATLVESDLSQPPSLVENDGILAGSKAETTAVAQVNVVRLAREVESLLRDPATQLAAAKRLAELVLIPPAAFGVTYEHLAWADLQPPEVAEAAVIRTLGGAGSRSVIEELKDMILSNNLESRILGARALAALLQHPWHRLDCREREPRPLIDIVVFSCDTFEKEAALEALAAWALIMVPLDPKSSATRVPIMLSRTLALALDGIKDPNSLVALICLKIVAALSFSRNHCLQVPGDFVSLAFARARDSDSFNFYACIVALNAVSYGIPFSTVVGAHLNRFAREPGDTGLAASLALGFHDCVENDSTLLLAVKILYEPSPPSEGPQAKFFKTWLMRRMLPKIIFAYVANSATVEGDQKLPSSILFTLECGLRDESDTYVYSHMLSAASTLLVSVKAQWTEQVWSRVGENLLKQVTAVLSGQVSAPQYSLSRARLIIAFALDPSMRPYLRQTLRSLIPNSNSYSTEMDHARLLVRALLDDNAEDKAPSLRWPLDFLSQLCKDVASKDTFTRLASLRSLTVIVGHDAVVRSSVMTMKAVLFEELALDSEGLMLLRALLQHPCGADSWISGTVDLSQARLLSSVSSVSCNLGNAWTLVMEFSEQTRFTDTGDVPLVLLCGKDNESGGQRGILSLEKNPLGFIGLKNGELGVFSAHKGWQGSKVRWQNVPGDVLIAVGSGQMTVFYTRKGFLGECLGFICGTVYPASQTTLFCAFPYACNPVAIRHDDLQLWPSVLGGSMRPEATRVEVAGYKNGLLVEQSADIAASTQAPSVDRLAALEVLRLLSLPPTRSSMLNITGIIGSLVGVALSGTEQPSIKAATFDVLRCLG